MKGRSLCAWILLVAAVLYLPGFARAGFPERPITLVVNYSAGGGVDLAARALAKKAEKILGQPIMVVNRPGAGGAIGLGALATAKPDGYTLGTATFGALTVAPHVQDLPFQPLRDFDYILGYDKFVCGLSARPDAPFKNLKELVAHAKAHPGKIKYGVQGLANTNNFWMIHLTKAEGIHWAPVVFKNTMEEVAACLGGHIDLTVQAPPSIVPYLRAGKLRLLVSFSDTRWEWAPDVPTVKEMGYNFSVESWIGLAAPQGVPTRILDELRDVFKKAFHDPEFLETMKRTYSSPAYCTPKRFQNLVEGAYRENETILLEIGLHKSQKK